MEGIMEKHCRLCGRVIAVRPAWEYSPRWNAICYCEDCRAAKRQRDKSDWQRQNRRDCRKTNKQLKTELMLSQERTAALEEANALLRQENAQLRRRVSGYKVPERSGIHSALSALCLRRKADLQTGG